MEPLSTNILVSLAVILIQGSPQARLSVLPAVGKCVRLGTFGSGPAAQPTQVGEFWKCGRCEIEAPLPIGYPAPTPPGAIELKSYPSVRRAEISSTGSTAMGMFSSFWPLFNHIKSREIAMTSPVEMDYRGMMEPNSNQLTEKNGSWTMSFLYRESDMGPIGKDGTITVVDTAPITVLSVGLKGAYGLKKTNEGLKLLNEWIAAHPAWRAVGDPRTFSYNGPAVRNGDKWSEVQLPIELKSAVLSSNGFENTSD